jgi:hypothetical protein
MSAASDCYACGEERYTRTAEPTNGGAACVGSSTLCEDGDGAASCPPFNFAEIRRGTAQWQYKNHRNVTRTVLANISQKGNWPHYPPNIDPVVHLPSTNTNTWEIEWDAHGGGSATVHAEELTMCFVGKTSLEGCN